MNTTYFLNLVAGNILQTKTNPGIPSKYYIGLSTTAPNASGDGYTEPSGGAYARVELNVLGAPSIGIVKNTSAIEFPESTASWGTITHYVIFDAATGGNLLMYGTLNSITIDSNTILVIKTNDLSISIIDPQSQAAE